MKKQGIFIFILVAFLDYSSVKSQESHHKRENKILKNQEISRWLDNIKLSSKNREFPRRKWLRNRPDVGVNEQDLAENKAWNAWKKHILEHPNSLPKVQFVKMSRNDQLDAQRSLAVLQPVAAENHVSTSILSVSAAVLFVVVLVICIHAPCTCLWRRRQRSELEVDLISCPNPTAHDGKCASIATINKEEIYMPYENQPWITESNKGQSSTLPNPKKSRSIVQAILKRSRDRDKFRYEFLASRYGYNYKQFRDSYKRSSIYDEQDPSWYSAGEFLNTQSNRSGQKNYGSTDAGKIGPANCCKWSRGQQQPTNQSVEDIIKLQPRRRQIVELQEFPVGYSGTYAGVGGSVQDNMLFDPYHDPKPCCHGNSESNLDMYFSRLDNNNHVTNTEKTYKNSKPTSTTTNTNIVQNFPTQFDYDPKFVQKEEDVKNNENETKKDREDDDDSDLYETSSDDLLSFDEWDAALERRQRRSQEFLYSPHMQASMQHQQCHHLHHSYPAVLRYPDIPRDTRPLPREYKTRMRRRVAQSELELRRSSGYFGQSASHCTGQSTAYHSSSDTSLHRMQIEKELTAAGLNKQRKKQKNPPVRIRDNRLDPLAGIMTPVRKLTECTKQTQNHSNSGDTRQKNHHSNTADPKEHKYLNNQTGNKHLNDSFDLKTRGKWENELSVCLKDDSYVVKLPSLDCKESVLLENDDEEIHKEEEDCYKEKLNNEKPEPNYSRVHLELDPHYIKNSYLREEPVRDTDSDDGERNKPTELTTGNIEQASINRDDGFSSNRSTRL